MGEERIGGGAVWGGAERGRSGEERSGFRYGVGKETRWIMIHTFHFQNISQQGFFTTKYLIKFMFSSECWNHASTGCINVDSAAWRDVTNHVTSSGDT